MRWQGDETIEQINTMDTFKQFVRSAGLAIGVILGLGLWMTIPYLVLGLGLIFIAWLLLSRTGNQVLAITLVGLSTLPQRIGATLVVIVGIGGCRCAGGHAGHGGRISSHSEPNR